MVVAPKVGVLLLDKRMKRSTKISEQFSRMIILNPYYLLGVSLELGLLYNLMIINSLPSVCFLNFRACWIELFLKILY